MGIEVLTDAFISIGGTDVSDHVKSLTLNYESEQQDASVFGVGTRINIGGLKNWSLQLQAHQDWAASELDSVLFPLVGTSCALVVRKSSSAKGVDNPEFAGAGILQGYTPIAGAVGEVAATPVTFNCAGALGRTTA